MILPKIPQMSDEQRYGTLLTSDITIYRKYFEELVTLQGIKAVYWAPRTDKSYNIHGELLSNY